MSSLAIGIASTVLGGLILHLIIVKSSKKQANVVNINSAESQITIKGITLKEISESLDKLPVLQKKQVEKSYQGNKITCLVSLSSVREFKNKYYITLKSKGSYFWISCSVEKKLYPRIKILKENEEFKIEGVIKSIEYGTIRLERCSILFSN